MKENRSGEEGLLVRAEPLELAEEISHRMVEVERLEDGAPTERRPRLGWGDQRSAGEEGREG